MRLRRLLVVLVGVFSLAAVAAGCGGASAPTDAASDGTADSDTAPLAAEPAAEVADESGEDTGDTADGASGESEADDEPTVDQAYVSPIGEALGLAEDERAAAYEDYIRDAEELTRQCMVEAGFEYTPVPTGIDEAARQRFELEGSLTTEQFTEQYGFGIASLFEANFKGQGVLNFVNQQFGPPPTVERSDAEQAAYEMALIGQTTQGLTPEEAQEVLFGDGGGNPAPAGSCRDHGYTNADNPGQVYDGLYALLGDELAGLESRFNIDPRVRQAYADWQSCMASRGFSYETRFAIFDELIEGSNDIANQYFSSPQILTALGEAQQQGLASMNNDDRLAFLEEVGALQGFSWVPDVQEQYDELVAFELQVAADSQDCGDEQAFEEVLFELQTEFVEQHADQLALIAAGDA